MKTPIKTGWDAIRAITEQGLVGFMLYNIETGNSLPAAAAATIASDDDPNKIGLRPHRKTMLVIPNADAERIIRSMGKMLGEVEVGQNWLATCYQFEFEVGVNYLIFYRLTGPVAVEVEMIKTIGRSDDWRAIASDTVAILEGGDK